MKIPCRCGALLVDSSDDHPHKAHLVSDQDWLTTLDAIDATIELAAGARIDPAAACQRVREVLVPRTRRLWQCRACGRLYVEGRDRQPQCFVPEGASVDRELLRRPIS